MASVAEYALPLGATCVEVPPAQPGVCAVCHGCPNPGWSTCWSCDQVMSQVSRPCRLVIPVSLYKIPSQLHTDLAGYKRSTHPPVRQQSSRRIIAILCHFLQEHRPCIARAAGGDWTTITNVPSTSTAGPHALVGALGLVPSFMAEYEALLDRGPTPIGHLTASDSGFVALRRFAGERVLLIDDTFTSGARAQSAASTLALAGADVVAIVAIGRVVDPAFSETRREFWADRVESPFTFDVCCVH